MDGWMDGAVRQSGGQTDACKGRNVFQLTYSSRKIHRRQEVILYYLLLLLGKFVMRTMVDRKVESEVQSTAR